MSFVVKGISSLVKGVASVVGSVAPIVAPIAGAAIGGPIAPIAGAVLGGLLGSHPQASAQVPSIPESPAPSTSSSTTALNNSMASAVTKPKALTADATQSGTLLTGYKGVLGDATTKKKVLLGQ